MTSWFLHAEQTQHEARWMVHRRKEKMGAQRSHVRFSAWSVQYVQRPMALVALELYASLAQTFSKEG